MEKSNEKKQVVMPSFVLRRPARPDKSSEKGASMVEYALLVGLIAVVAIAAVRLMGERVSTQFATSASQI